MFGFALIVPASLSISSCIFWYLVGLGCLAMADATVGLFFYFGMGMPMNKSLYTMKVSSCATSGLAFAGFFAPYT